MKYIISDAGEVIIFSGTLKHKDIADKLGISAASAGFVAGVGQMVANGGSSSLGVSCKVEDCEKIEAELMF